MYRNTSTVPGTSKRERRNKGWSMFQRSGSAHVTDSGATVLWLPYCTHRDRCAAGDAQDASCRADCLKLVTELNREVSSHHTLALALGGSGDCGQLRDELKRARRRAQELAKQARLKLLPCLHDQKLSERDRGELERLWYLYCCCACVLECEMRRSLVLQRLFSLHARGFIKTGLCEQSACSALHHKPVAAVAAAAAMGGLRPAAEALDVPLTDRLALEGAELNQLHKEIAELRELVPELQTSDSWEDDWQPSPLKEPSSHSASSEDSLYSDPGSQVEGPGMTLQQRRCVCWAFLALAAVFITAVVLGLSVALVI